MEHLRQGPLLNDVPFVLTTTNVKRVREVVGDAEGELHDRRQAVRPWADRQCGEAGYRLPFIRSRTEPLLTSRRKDMRVKWQT